MIKAVIFDWFGVITPRRGLDTSQRLSDMFGLSLDAARAFYIEKSALLKIGKITEVEFWTAFDTEFPDAPPADRDTIWFDSEQSVPDPRMVELVHDLKSSGITVAVLSNTFPVTARDIRRAGHYDLFDMAFLSSEIGLCKPHADFFEACIKEFGLRPEKILFVDDQAKNTAAAERLGLHVLIADPATDVPAEVRRIVQSE